MSGSKSINTFLLTMINVAAVLSIRNWPLTAEYGFASLTFIVLVVLFFLIPSGLVAAELATTWPEKGGVFAWVKLALGEKWGVLAIWLLWVENVICYPLLLSFVAGSIAYAISPDLANNRWYMFTVILATFWIITIVNLKGIKVSGLLSTIGVLLGTILPGLFIIGLGIAWVGLKETSQINFTLKGLVPNLSNFGQLSFLAGLLLALTGIEMPAVHAKDVIHPHKTYGRAIFWSVSIIIVLSILGTLTIAVVVPSKQINLIAGGIEAIYMVLNQFHLQWLVPVVAILIAIGALAGITTWAAGPCRGLVVAGEGEKFPAFMQKVNKHDMPSGLMLLQAVIISLLSTLFVFMPSVNSSFWILTVLASQVYLIMYLLLFTSALVLRYTHKSTDRVFKIPGGTIGMWIVCLMGLLSSLFAIIVGFFPPTQISVGNTIFFVIALIVGISIFCIVPFLIHRKR